MNIKSNYQGSQITKSMVEEQIRSRWGSELASKYDPYHNCLTFKKWAEAGYIVKPGERSIRSKVFIEVEGDNGEVIRKYPKTIHLFFFNQVEKAK